VHTRSTPQLRVARPSLDLDAATSFYTTGLGLDVLGTFADHAGFDGVLLGHAEWPYHLELTRRCDGPATPRCTDEDLLVFYLPDRAEWEAAVQRLHALGARSVPPSNPYWSAHGLTFRDPDGHRLVLQHGAWP
jgi:catechol 2,3-dioxygenase-like lactoylglutathione lyase family enzyme